MSDCDVTRSGLRVVSNWIEKTIRFGTDDVVFVGTRALFVAAESVNGQDWCAFAGGDDVARLVNRRTHEITVLGKISGVRPVLVTTRGVYWVDRDSAYYWAQPWGQSPAKHPIPIGRTSQGLSYQEPSGTLRWADEFQPHPVVKHGVRLHDPYVDGDWIFGMRANNGLLAYRISTDQLFDVNQMGNFGPRGRQMADGSAVIAINRYGRFADNRTFTVIPFEHPTPDDPEPDDPEDEMSQTLLVEINKRLSRIEQRIADQQEESERQGRDLAAIKAHVLKLVPGPTPEPPAPEPPSDPGPPADEPEPVIDLKQVVWLHTDVSDWAETSHIERVGIEWPKHGDPDNGTVCFPHTKAGKWPTFDNGQGEGNVWVFGKIGGTWYAATCEWLKPGQTCKRFSNRTEPNSWGIGPHTKQAPLKAWGPQSGEWIGIMVSGRARDSGRSVEERSNVCLVRWP